MKIKIHLVIFLNNSFCSINRQWTFVFGLNKDGTLACTYGVRISLQFVVDVIKKRIVKCLTAVFSSILQMFMLVSAAIAILQRKQKSTNSAWQRSNVREIRYSADFITTDKEETIYSKWWFPYDRSVGMFFWNSSGNLGNLAYGAREKKMIERKL